MANLRNRKINCCFCGKTINERKSNNPDPANTVRGSRCCLECDYKIVLPARAIIAELIDAGTTGKRLESVSVPDYSPIIEHIRSMQAAPSLSEKLGRSNPAQNLAVYHHAITE